MHSPERTLSEVKVRRPLRGQPGMHRAGREDHRHRHPLGALAACRSARGGSPRRAPPPRPRRGCARARPAARSAAAGREGAVDLAPPRRRTAATIAAKRAFETNGLSSCRISVCELSWSSTFLRLPNRVFSAHHPMLAQAVDRRVGHLAEVLPEVVAERPVARRQHRGRRVVAHRADRLLAVLGHRVRARSRAPRPSSPPRSAAGAARRPSKTGRSSAPPVSVLEVGDRADPLAERLARRPSGP